MRKTMTLQEVLPASRAQAKTVFTTERAGRRWLDSPLWIVKWEGVAAASTPFKADAEVIIYCMEIAFAAGAIWTAKNITIT